MTFSWPNEKTVVHRLRVRAAGLDPQAVRLRAEFALESVDLRPPGLPPAAVLCVRRLRDPCPGGLDLSHPGQPASPHWERAVQEALAELARGAARPAREPVPAGAQAVLFADRAELIACLTRDWLDGCLYERWWWRGLLRPDLDPLRLVARTWAEAPAYIPAALERLASCGRALEFVCRLDQAAARQVLAAFLDFFDLPEVKILLESPPQPASPPAAAAVPVAPPWHPHVPESRLPGLDPVRQALLGLALVQRRAPGSIRTAASLAELRGWCENAVASPEQSQALPAEPPGHPARDRPAQPGPTAPTRTAWAPVPPAHPGAAGKHRNQAAGWPPPESPAGKAAEIRSAPVEWEPARLAAAPSARLPDQPPGIQTAGRAEPPAPLAPAPRQEPQQMQPVALPDQPMPRPELLEGSWFETGFGGVFYLVNLALFLGLYTDFTQPRTPGIDLPIWDFLALAGRLLAGPGLEADPLWEWLARLAGRPTDQAPGAEFAPPAAWRMPPDWLEPFAGPGVWTWSSRGGRLRVDHPAGFRILDVPAVDEPSRQLKDETRPYQAFVRRLRRGRQPGPKAAAPPLEAWLGWLVPYLRQRLLLALGLAHPDELAGLLCARPARVYLTESHLDVTFFLADLPVEIRLSGLDRDPGWVPAAGRYVIFHYEN